MPTATTKRHNGKPAANGHAPPALSSALSAERSALNGQPPPIPGHVQRLPLDRLERHPDNRTPTPEAIAERAASLKEHGQLEPIVVRPLPAAGHGPEARGTGEPRYQILSGETRVLGARELGWTLIEARVLEGCDDAQALVTLALANAQRRDLDPIERAKLLRKLCTPADRGGAGLTSDGAAQLYGLADGGSVRNLLRLLELPEAWQERVASGALPQSAARLILRVRHVPATLAALDRDWHKAQNGKHEYHREQWSRREGVERIVEEAIRWTTRPVLPGQRADVTIPGEYDTCHEFLPELTEELRLQLGVVSITEEGKAVERAVNVKLWDKLQTAAVKELLAKKADRREQRGAKAERAAATPAEQRQRRDNAAKQVAERVERWRHRWLRELLAARLGAERPDGIVEVVEKLPVWCVRLVLAWGAARPGYYSDPQFDGLLEQALIDQGGAREKGEKRRQMLGAYVRCEIVAPDGRVDAAHGVLVALARRMLLAESRDPRRSLIEPGVVDRMAAEAKVDLAAEWLRADGRRERLAAYLACLDAAAMRAAAAEWDVYAAESAPRKQVAALIEAAGESRALPLPGRLAARKRGARSAKR